MLLLRHFAPAALAALGAVLLCTPARAQVASAPAPRPRLIVLLVVDQMIPEQLDRLAPWFGGGFGRFVREGRAHRDTMIDYGITVTSPGHATLSTGVQPCKHGIVANERYEEEQGSIAMSVSDAKTERVGAESQPVGARRGGSSPSRMRVPGIADWLARADPASKSFTISTKDRSAILLSGQHADLALWWDFERGGFNTSSWYADALPNWATTWNAGWKQRLAPEGRPWVWQSALPEGIESSGTAPDDQEGESPWFSGGRKFPHPAPALHDPPKAFELGRIANYVYASPLGDEFCIELSRLALENMQLGADEHVDLMCISLSGCDAIGHAMGPFSREVTDLLLRDDRLLAGLFADIDRIAGKDGWIAALSSDHGVLDLPERLLARGIGAKRVPWTETQRMAQALRAKSAELGAPDAIGNFDGWSLYLKRAALAAAGSDLSALRRALADLILAQMPSVARVYTSEELRATAREGQGKDDAWRVLAARCYDEERSADVIVQYQPWSLVSGAAGTSHGSPYPYDRHIPLVFLGPGFAPGPVYAPASSVDVLPTLLKAAGVALPEGLDGHALE